jgi:hypothetical protein
MSRRSIIVYPMLLLASATALSDSLSGTDRFLCSAVEATVCTADGICESGPPWDWRIPQFLIVDLDRKELSTTEASGENRMTPILNLSREDGHIVLQGTQAGRAFSMVLQEDNGHAAIAIATDGVTISVFGACTPAPAR